VDSGLDEHTAASSSAWGATVIGGGAAGLMAAAVLAASVRTVLVTDRGLGTSNSVMAQGGLQVPTGPHEAAQQAMIDDLIASGGAETDPDLVRQFVEDILPTVELLEKWGLRLDRHPDGRLVRHRAGGLSEPRIVGTADQIGPAVIKVLRSVVAGSGIEVLTHCPVVDLAPGPKHVVVTTATGEQLRCEAAVVATGGRTFEHATTTGQRSTNPANANSVLTPVLSRLGLVRSPDRFQYQPFGLVEVSGSGPGRCVPESIIEHGVELIDGSGQIVSRVDVGRARLTAAMFEAERQGRAIRSSTGEAGFRLTLSSVPPDALTEQFPKLAATLERAGMLGADVLVYPFLHYELSGFRMAVDCSTPLPGVFLAGEAATGVHGRNRLMGAGLMDSLVHGRRAAHSVLDYLASGRSSAEALEPTTGSAPESSAGSGQ